MLKRLSVPLRYGSGNMLVAAGGIEEATSVSQSMCYVNQS